MRFSFCEDYHIREIRRMKTGLKNQIAMQPELTLLDFRRTPAAGQ